MFHHANRPNIVVHDTRLDRALRIAGVLGVFACVALSLISMPFLPDSIPVHFGFTGGPTRWGTKWTLLVIPGVATFTVLGLWVVLRMPPHAMNYPVRITEENAERQYRIARRMILTLLVIIPWKMTLLATEMVIVARGGAFLGRAFLPLFLVSVFGAVSVGIYKSVRAR